MVESNFGGAGNFFLIIFRALCRSIHASFATLTVSSVFCQARVPKATWLSAGVALAGWS